MATLTTQQITRTGGVPSYVAATSGNDSFTAGDDTVIHVKNGGGGSITATVATAGITYLGIALANTQITVPAGQERMFGPFPYQFYGDSTDGLTDIFWSGVTTVTVAVFNLKQP